MGLVLILSSIIMYYIVFKYDYFDDWDVNYYFDIIVQILHVITFFVITDPILKFDTLPYRIFSIINMCILGKKLLFLVLSVFLGKEPIENDDKEDGENNKNKNNDEEER